MMLVRGYKSMNNTKETKKSSKEMIEEKTETKEKVISRTENVENKLKDNKRKSLSKEEKAEKRAKFIASRKDRILITILASLFLPLTMFVGIPMLVFANNISEFLFSWYDFVPICCIFALIVAAALFALLYFLPKKAYKICLNILIAFNILMFLQSTYLNGSLSLAGDNMGNGISTASKIINLIFWLLMFAGFVVLALLKDKKKYIKTTSLVLLVIITATQFISTLAPIISSKNFFKSANSRIASADSKPVAMTYKGFETYSNQNKGNIYYFVIDRFDENFAEAAYENKSKFYDKLNGFTWFQDNIAMYGHTFPAVAYALTGNEYSSEENREAYLKSAYEGETYLKELSDAGYKVKLYTDSYYAYNLSSAPANVENAEEVTATVKSKFVLSMKMIGLGLYVSAPLITKTLFNFVSTSSFDKLMDFQGKEDVGYATDNETVEEYINSMTFESSDDKQFSFIHFSGLHDYQGNAAEKSIEKLDYCMDMIFKFIDNLKEKGLYDSSTIVITGDHSSPYNNFVGVSEPRLTALFFKPAQTAEDAAKPLQISNNKVEQKNIMPTIFESIGVESQVATAKGATSLFSTDSSERIHTWHTYVGDVVVYTYKITGSGKNIDNWKEISKIKYSRNIMD